jgi:hypothetical protein
MASCPACGADITHARTEAGENVPLEKWTDTVGEDRYRVVAFGPPLTVAKVSESAPIAAYPDHRKDCPDYGNGLRV